MALAAGLFVCGPCGRGFAAGVFGFLALQQGEDVGLGPCACGLVDDGPVFDDNQRGDGHDLEFLGQLRLFVDVDFADQVLRVFGRDFVYDGGQHAAGAAPVGVKVEENGLGACLYGIEVFFVYNLYGHWLYLPFFDLLTV